LPKGYGDYSNPKTADQQRAVDRDFDSTQATKKSEKPATATSDAKADFKADPAKKEAAPKPAPAKKEPAKKEAAKKAPAKKAAPKKDPKA
jgi:hypothetical protein